MNKDTLIKTGIVTAVIVLAFGMYWAIPERDAVDSPTNDTPGPTDVPVDTELEKPEGWDKLIDNNPQMREEQKIKTFERFQVIIERIPNEPTKSIHWYDLGVIKNSLMDYDGAEAAWLHSVAINDDNGPAYVNLGHHYANTVKDHKKAEEMYKKAIKVDLQGNYGPAVYRDLSDLYRYRYPGKEDQVDDILLEGISAYTNSVDIRTHLASYYDDVDEYALAIKYYEEALVLKPGDQSIINEIEDIKVKL